MSNLLKILGLFVELVHWLIRTRQQEKQREEIETVRRDPVGAFRDEFAGVPDNEAAGHSMPSDQASVEINSK